MSKGTILLKNTLILGFGTVASQFIGFLLLPLYTRYLSPGEYGYVDVVTVYLSLLIPALTLQLNMASFRFLIDVRGDLLGQSKVISNIFALVVILVFPWIVIFGIAGFVLGLDYFELIILTGISTLISQQSMQLTRGLGNNLHFAIGSILIGLFTLVLAFVFIVWLNFKVAGMFYSLILANLLGGVYLIVKMQLYKRLNLRLLNRTLQKEILGYSIPLVPNGLAWWTNNAASRVIITYILGTVSNGIYAVANKFSSILNSLFSVFTMSWTESATLHVNDPDRNEFFSQVANSAVRIFGSLGICLVSVIPFVFPIMVDPQFNDALNYIPIMVLGVFFNTLVGIYSAIYVAKKLTKKVMNTTVAAAIINIVLTFGLVPVFGLFGAAGATAVTFFALAVFRHFDVKKFVEIRYQYWIFVLLAGVFGVVVVLYYSANWWLQGLGLGIAIVSGASINRKQIVWVLRRLIGKAPIAPNSQHARHRAGK